MATRYKSQVRARPQLLKNAPDHRQPSLQDNLSDTKQNYDAAPLLRAAKARAGKIPRPYIADGLDQYHIAFKKMFYTLKGLRSIHIRDIHIRNLFCNTNKQERLNGEFASRFKPARGINREESLIFRITTTTSSHTTA